MVPTAHVAIKELRDPVDDDAFAALAGEMSGLSALAIPEVAPLLEVGVDGGAAYVAMELAVLGSLECPSRPLRRQEVLAAVADAAMAAHALHLAGRVHANIKPANVLLHGGGGWLSDAAPAALPWRPAPVEYVDPSILRGVTPSPSTDVWSLGVTMHRALTGASLYGEVPDVDRNAAISHVLGTPPRLGEGLDPSEARVIGACLAPASGERPATARAVAERIQPLLRGTG